LSNLTGRIIKGSALLASARVLSNLLGWVGTIVLARLLTPEDYGLVAIGTMVQAIVAAMTEMSFGEALLRHRAPERDHFDTAWTLGLVRGVILAGLLVLTAHPLALFYGDPRLEMVIFAFAAGTFLSSMNNPRWILLQKDLDFRHQFVLSLAARMVAVLVSIIVAIAYQSFWALILGTLASQVVGVGMTYLAMPYRPRLRCNRARELWSFSIWLTLGQAINTINWRFDQLVVGKLLGRMELGYYSVGENLAQMPTREAITPLRQTLFPAFNKMSGDVARLRAAYQRVQGLISAIALPTGAGFALVAEPLVHAAMGGKWLPAVPVIQALAAVFAFQTFGSIVQPLAMSVSATKVLFVRDLVLFFVRLPIILLGLVLGGLPGLIIARVVTGTLGTFINMDLVRRLSGLGIVEQFRCNQRTLLAVSIMAVGVILFRDFLDTPASASVVTLLLDAVGSAFLGASLYVLASYLLWRLQGSRDGPEREIAQIAARILTNIRSRRIREVQ
jgi:O-antigen/teichoic acid export membrane protein